MVSPIKVVHLHDSQGECVLAETYITHSCRHLAMYPHDSFTAADMATEVVRPCPHCRRGLADRARVERFVPGMWAEDGIAGADPEQDRKYLLRGEGW